MRKVFITGAGSLLLAGLLGLGGGTSQAGNCQDALDNHRYRCHINAGAGVFELCFHFVSPGTHSPHFDLGIDGPAVIGCTCKATGTVKDPNLNASKEFFCVEPIDSTNAQALEGKVSGNGQKIKGGFTSNAEGDGGVFECELDPT